MFARCRFKTTRLTHKRLAINSILCFKSALPVDSGRCAQYGGINNIAANAFALCSTEGDAHGVLLCANDRALLWSNKIWQNSCAKVNRIPDLSLLFRLSMLTRIVGLRSLPANATPRVPQRSKFYILDKNTEIFQENFNPGTRRTGIWLDFIQDPQCK